VLAIGNHQISLAVVSVGTRECITSSPGGSLNIVVGSDHYSSGGDFSSGDHRPTHRRAPTSGPSLGLIYLAKECQSLDSTQQGCMLPASR